MIPTITTSSIYLFLGAFLAQLISPTNAVNPTKASNSGHITACGGTEVRIEPSWPMRNIPESEADARPFTCRSEAVTCCFRSCPNALETYCRYDICFLLAMAVSGLKWFGLSGPCTLAVTTLAAVPLGSLSTEVPQGPYPLYGYTIWHSIWENARELLKSFFTERNQARIIAQG